MRRVILLLLILLQISTIRAEEEDKKDAPVARIVLTPSVTTIQRAVGADVHVMCRVDNTENDDIGLAWSKRHGKGIDATGNVRVEKLDSRNIGLYITNGTENDSGYYECAGSGKFGFRAAFVDIFFINEFRFIDTNSHIDRIMDTVTVNISCRVNPAEGDSVKTTWSKQGALLPVQPEKFMLFSGGAILQIKNFDSRHDPGQYVCLVENLTTGYKIRQEFAVGGRMEARRATCVNQCENFCTNLFNNIV